MASNPRYFTDGSGRAVYLTGSHTWNNLQDWGTSDPPPAFDFGGYLDLLSAHDHNLIRLWAWEQAWGAPWTPDDFRIAPLPYARTGPGLALDGGPKFDVDRFDPEYFSRLRDRVAAARARGIYVSVMLFQGWAIDNVEKCSPRGCGEPWAGHPLNRSNNVNGIDGDADGNGQGDDVHTLADPRVTEVQKAYVRRVVDTVNDLDNVLYEITNESGVLLPASTRWQHEMIDHLKSYQAAKPNQHPVGMTFEHPKGSNASLFESGADWVSPGPGDPYKDDPPPADGSKVVISDTDHLWGGGGNGDWVWRSFTRGLNTLYMDSLNALSPSIGLTDGFGHAGWETVRRAMGDTRRYADRIGLAAMSPRGGLASTGFALANPGREYLVYQPGSGPFSVDVSPGTYDVEWHDPGSGTTTAGEAVTSGPGSTGFRAPFAGPAVLLLQRKAPPEQAPRALPPAGPPSSG